MRISQTSRSPGGLTNAAPGQTLGNAGLPDPSWALVYHDDFEAYDSALYTATVVGTGTQAQAAAEGGAILVSNTNGIADATYLQRPAAAFKLTATKPAFYKFAGTLSDVTNDVFYCGLIATSTTPLAAADGVFIRKATAQAGLALVSVIGGVTTSVAFPATALLVAATAFELGIEIDAVGTINAYFNPSTGKGPAPANTPRGPVASIVGASLTQVLLNPSFGLLNSTAATRTLTADYQTAVRER